jgi:lysophospholipase L1-like esterase
MKMKVKLRVLFPIALLVALSLVTIANQREFATEKHEIRPQPPLQKMSVAIVGDSWATHDLIATSLANTLKVTTGQTAQVHNHGLSGARSKLVYQSLFFPISDHRSNQSVLSEPVSYCVIFVGVNDAANRIGSDFYAFHTKKIVDSVLQRGATPVVVLLPHFGEVEYLSTAWVPSRVKAAVFGELFDRGELPNVDRYRIALRGALASEEDRVVFVDPDSALGTYDSNNKMWGNSAHPSQDGDQALGREIAEALADRLVAPSK